jgi:hypothetical protein
MDVFRKWMKESSGPQKQRLADLAGVNFFSLYNIASGHRNASADYAARVEFAAAVLKGEGHNILPQLRREHISKTCAECPYVSAQPGFSCADAHSSDVNGGAQ